MLIHLFNDYRLFSQNRDLNLLNNLVRASTSIIFHISDELSGERSMWENVMLVIINQDASRF